MGKSRKRQSLHERLAEYKRRGRARDEHDLAAGRISREELFRKNFFFEGLDFSKARIIRAGGQERSRSRPAKAK